MGGVWISRKDGDRDINDQRATCTIEKIDLVIDGGSPTRKSAADAIDHRMPLSESFLDPESRSVFNRAFQDSACLSVRGTNFRICA
jgi:hypothetical protein